MNGKEQTQTCTHLQNEHVVHAEFIVPGGKIHNNVTFHSEGC